MNSLPQAYLNHGQYDFLDMPKILKEFASFFHFTVNGQNLLACKEEKNRKSLTWFYDQQDHLIEIDNLKDILSKTNKDYDFSSMIKKVDKKHVLKEEEFYDLYNIINSATDLFSFVNLSLFNAEELKERWRRKSNLKILLSELEKLIDTDERCLFLAKHILLKPIAKKISLIEITIRKKIKSVEENWASEGLTSQDIYDFVDSKYVIPVRSDRYHGGLGKIISRSNTGYSLYIEPKEIEDLVNNKNSLLAEYEREKFKILNSYTTSLYDDRITMRDLFGFIKMIDRGHAHALVSQHYSFTRPKFTKKKIKINNAFHPLIENPVKNNILLEENQNGLLISGPNTGGKTILLKTLALHFLLPSLGFYVPASSASLPYATSCYFFANDQQSISDGLSSFSSESKNYLSILSKIDSDSYIFIDEIFNSTSSQEASAIALALIKAYLNKGSRLFISSHHEGLKESIFNNQLLVSAHMGFESKTRMPSYRFFSGTPGNSFAIDVFKNLEDTLIGSPQVTIHLEKDKKYSNEKEKLVNINLLESKLIKMTREQEHLKQSLIKKRESIDSILNLEKDKLVKFYESKWTETKDKIYKLSEDIKKNQRTNINTISLNLNEIKPEILEEKVSQSNDQISKENSETNVPIKVGDFVTSKGLKQSGEVIKISSHKYYVQLKKIKVWLTKDDLNLSQKQARQEHKQTIKTTFINDNETNGNLLYDARGVRREDFLFEVERHIYSIINGDLPFIDIIHGHGDGILRKALYQELRKFKELQYDHLEGNLGTTRVSIKK